MTETRKIAAILVADIVGFSRLVEADEARTLSRLRTLRGDVTDPAFAAHNGRVFKRTGDGAIVEFRSVVDAVRCAIEVQDAMAERNAGVAADSRIEFRIGVHVGDVVEESDGDLMGDGVNVAARLEGVCVPGGVCLSEEAYRQLRDKVKDRFVDLGDQKLKNISRPVRVYLLASKDGIRSSSPLALPEKPSIAVLPFQNMSGDPEQEYFADGMVEDIITGLSRIKWLFVIARNSSFIYKGKAVDVRQVGRELGVRYVLEGGVRKAGSRVRITAQLLEAETGAHLWADKYDGALEDVFDLQDQITDRVVGIVEPSLRQSEIERSRRKRPENLGAYDLYLRALPHVAAQMPADAKIALPLLQESLRLDPDYAPAHAHIAWCHELCYARGGFDVADKKAALSHARTAIASKTDDATALAVAGFVIAMLADRGSADQQAALDAIDRALSLNASCATALYLGAHAHALAGHLEQAPQIAHRALRLSPFDPMAFQAHMALGLTAIQEARFEDAANAFAAAGRVNTNFSTPYLFQAFSLALAGDDPADARAVAGRGLELEPGFRMSNFFAHAMPPLLRERLVEGARRLGMA
jgi:TolB-like protein/class 3 adenylate cyclase